MIPVTTQGTVIVREPIGTNDYVNAAIQQVLADCDQEFQKLVRFPFATVSCFFFVTAAIRN
jgi:hypothetical protein